MKKLVVLIILLWASMAVAMPAIPKGAENIGGGPVGQCGNKVILLYVYKFPNGEYAEVWKEPNKPARVMALHKDIDHGPYVVYDRDEQITWDQLLKRYETMCDAFGEEV